MQSTVAFDQDFQRSTPSPRGQQPCSCGGVKSGGECAACRAKRLRAARATAPTSSATETSSGYAPSRIPIERRGGRSPLHVSEPSDPTEVEADRIAKQLFPLGRSARLTAAPAVATRSSAVQRSSGGGRPSSAAVKVAGGGSDVGTPLPARTRAEMEGAFGADFSPVRVHTGSEAAQLSRSMRASAFAYGDDIFFDNGSYEPESQQGKQLLAHELAHTLQQRGTEATVDRQGHGRSVLGCVNDNLSAAGVAAWLLAIVGTTCGLIGAIAGSPTGPGAAGTAAAAAAACVAGVVGFSVGAVLAIFTGCMQDPAGYRSRGAYISSTGGEGAPGGGGPAGGGAPADSGTATANA